jgi:hypothetical protein
MRWASGGETERSHRTSCPVDVALLRHGYSLPGRRRPSRCPGRGARILAKAVSRGRGLDRRRRGRTRSRRRCRAARAAGAAPPPEPGRGPPRASRRAGRSARRRPRTRAGPA